MTLLLSVQSLGRSVGGRPLLAELSFEMRAGEVLALLGPSGSGKTSLLRLIAGFDAPSSGSLLLQGEPASVAGRVLRPPERRGLGLAFQDATLFPHLDAIGNVVFAIREGSRAERLARARAALAEMGLAGMEGREVSSLSGGEAQRVALARAFAAEARLLLLDEPFGNVDRPTRADLLQRLRARLSGDPGGPGALIITHDPADALELGARILLLREGRLLADGSHAEITAGACGDWARQFLAGSRAG